MISWPTNLWVVAAFALVILSMVPAPSVAGRRIKKDVLWSVFVGLVFWLAAAMTGCATLKPDCEAVCVRDTCVHYCETQERVTRRCAKNAFKSDTGDVWQDDGSYIGEDGKRYIIAVCTEYYPKNFWSGLPSKYPFHMWVWKNEAWREGHERCHRQVYLDKGSLSEHQRRCHDFGLGRGKRRM